MQLIKINLKERNGDNDTDGFHDEIAAVFDKLLEYERIQKTQNNFFISFNVSQMLKLSEKSTSHRSLLECDHFRYTRRLIVNANRVLEVFPNVIAKKFR